MQFVRKGPDIPESPWLSRRVFVVVKQLTVARPPGESLAQQHQFQHKLGAEVSRRQKAEAP